MHDGNSTGLNLHLCISIISIAQCLTLLLYSMYRDLISLNNQNVNETGSTAHYLQNMAVSFNKQEVFSLAMFSKHKMGADVGTKTHSAADTSTAMHLFY